MSALFHILKEQNINVHLFGPRQKPDCPANLTNVQFTESFFRLYLFHNPKYYFSHLISFWRIIKHLRKEKVGTLLAVDPLGIITGGRLKKLLRQKIHLSYLSFEIFFKNELTTIYYKKLKEKEIYYSNIIDSLLVQDEKRKELLLQENKISLSDDKIILVPVSPMKFEIREKVDIHEKFSISRNKKLAVYSGSTGEWCGTRAIIEAFDKGYWNNNYWLVFHTRNTISEKDSFYSDLMRLNNDVEIPFTLHSKPFNGFEELASFLIGFDLALALYFPNKQNPYYGKNLEEIGLSSGKFSLYMMVGLLTIVTSCTIYEKLVKKYFFGNVIYSIDELSNAMHSVAINKNETLELYNNLLNPKVSLAEYLKLL
jgi:hypothetical protein